MEQNKQDILNKKETEKMCLSGDCELGKMCSTEDFATCGDGMFIVQTSKQGTYRDRSEDGRVGFDFGGE